MLTELTSTDCEELSDNLPHTELAFRQLEPGPFRGALRRLELPGVTLVDQSLSQKVGVVGVVEPGYFGALVPVQQNGTLNVAGDDFDDRYIFWSRRGMQHTIKAPPDFVGYSLEIPLQSLREHAEALEMSLPPAISDVERVRHSKACAAASRLIRSAFHAIGQISEQELASQLTVEWLRLLRVIFSQPRPVDRSTLLQRRRAALDVANYLRTHIFEDLSLPVLCRIAGVSDRTLRTGFHEMFGISPKRWLKAERLSAARVALKSADPKRDQVRTIACKYGFLQFAHFATDYRKQFGESPSETLRRPHLTMARDA